MYNWLLTAMQFCLFCYSLAAAFIHGQLNGVNVVESLELGLNAARLSLQTYKTVPDSIESILRPN